MAGLSVAVEGYTDSRHRSLVPLYLLLFMVKDDKSHGYHDLAIIVEVIQISVDGIIKEKLVETIPMVYDN
jgi:hypothetical protein